MGEGGKCRVYASLSTKAPPYRACVLLKEGEMTGSGHKVFGPASYEECRAFIRDNCGG